MTTGLMVGFYSRLERNVITPTTKAADHDEPISPDDIVAQNIISQEDWHVVCTSHISSICHQRMPGIPNSRPA